MVVPAPSVQVATIRSCSGATARRWPPPALLNLLLDVPRSYKRRLEAEQPRKAKSNTPPAILNPWDLASKKRRQIVQPRNWTIRKYYIYTSCWLFYCKQVPRSHCSMYFSNSKEENLYQRVLCNLVQWKKWIPHFRALSSFLCSNKIVVNGLENISIWLIYVFSLQVMWFNFSTL